MDFYERLTLYLKSEFRDKLARQEESTLYALLKEQTALAQLYKFTSETEIVRFIDLLWRIGPNFDTDPTYAWSREILANIRLSSEDKIKMLRDAYAMGCAQRIAETV